MDARRDRARRGGRRTESGRRSSTTRRKPSCAPTKSDSHFFSASTTRCGPERPWRRSRKPPRGCSASTRVTRVGYAEIEGGGYVIRHEYTRGVPPLAGQLSGTFGGGTARGVSARRNRGGERRRDGSEIHGSRACRNDERQIAAFIGVMLMKDGRLVAAFGANNATPRVWTPTRSRWSATSPNGPGTRSNAPAPRRRCGSANSGLRLALDASAGGSWTWDAAPIRSIGMTPFVRYTASRPTSRRRSRRGCRACTRRIARRCSGCSRRS